MGLATLNCRGATLKAQILQVGGESRRALLLQALALLNAQKALVGHRKECKSVSAFKSKFEDTQKMVIFE
jgi:hypothetical protein